jgi:alkylation response protein AidB-like acyl-CoA dehydrogenase
MTVETGELRASARQVVEGLGLAADADKAWSLVAELGWLMLEIPEADDGLGLGLPAACALHGELGRGLATAPYLAASLAVDALAQSAVSDRAEWLARLGSGEAYIAVPLAGSAAEFEDGRLNGLACAVPSADRAGHVLVWSAAADCVALAPTADPAIEAIARPTWDRTRRLFDIQLHRAAVDPGLVLARGAAAEALLSRLLVRRDFALAAESVGGAGAILERTVAYLGERHQFGRPLAMFQALKHRCADLKTQVEAAAALLEDSLAQAIDDNGDFGYTARAAAAGQAAKLHAATVYTAVTEESLQLHGGIGMTSEHDCHQFLKRAMLDEHLGRGRDFYGPALAAGRLADRDWLAGSSRMGWMRRVL